VDPVHDDAKSYFFYKITGTVKYRFAKKDLMYKLFMSTEGDWYVAAKKTDENPIVLYEGHHHELALEAIVQDLGIEIPIVEKDMDDLGTYIPAKDDF
jgi:hypothetical protein